MFKRVFCDIKIRLKNYISNILFRYTIFSQLMFFIIFIFLIFAKYSYIFLTFFSNIIYNSCYNFHIIKTRDIIVKIVIAFILFS